MVGLLSPAEYVDCVEHAYPHARARARLHGAEGPHRPRPLQGRVGGDAVLHRGAGGGRLQVGVDPGGQRAVRAAGGVLDPDLHAPGDRLPARDLRRLVPHAHAHRRVGGVFGAAGSRARTRRCSRSSAAGSSARGSLATCDTVFAWDEVRIWSRTQASVDRFLAEQAPKYPHLRLTGTTDVRAAVEGADVIVTGTHARTLARRRRLGEAGRAHRGARRRPEGRAGARPAHASARRGSSSTTSASAARTARSTSRSPRG